MVATVITTVATSSTAMLMGKAARPFNVSGVATAPSEMPTSTEMTRDNGAGTISGRPASAAAATDSSDPEISPAGKPIHVNRAPPTAAISSVSAVRSIVRRETTEIAIAAINAVPVRSRQMALGWRISAREP